MKLQKVTIKNFRSIKEATIDFDPMCRVLIGINESGKSNILKALSLISKDEFDSNDIRFGSLDEALVVEADISYKFKLEDSELDEVIKKANKKILSIKENPFICAEGEKSISVKEMFYNNRIGFHRVLIKENAEDSRGYSQCYSISKKYKPLLGWAKPSASCPEESVVKSYKLVFRSDYPEEIDENFEIATSKDINELYSYEIRKAVRENLPECILWKYSNRYILPGEIVLDDFANDLDSCIPLKLMFKLAGYDDIPAAIDKIKNATVNVAKNDLLRISNKATNHIKNAWPEYAASYPDVEFEIEKNENKLRISIKEKNVYDYDVRSEGFKRLVSFLIIVSSRVDTGNLKNSIVLLDEPDLGLHPSSVKCLRDELIKISQTNYVVYGTHSPYMMDIEEIDRHLTIKKINEETQVIKPIDMDKTYYLDGEVLYEALGTSMVDFLDRKIIFFEGVSDIGLLKQEIKKLDKHIISFFTNDCFLYPMKGVSKYRQAVFLAELYNCKYFVISDADPIALKAQIEYIEGITYTGKWLSYSDFGCLKEKGIVTTEDFFSQDKKSTAFKNCVDESGYLSDTEIGDILDPEKGIVNSVKKALKGNRVSDTKCDEFIRQFKDNILKGGINENDITSTHKDFIEELAQLVNGKKVAKTKKRR